MFRLGLETFSKMPWYFPWSDAIKKRAIRYLLQRYVGQFLEEKLSLDQLTVDLYNGTGTIKELTLDMGALNEVADQLNLPLRFVDGYIGEICVSIPWHALLSESCFVEVSGLMVTIEPKQMSEDISMVDSMIESMNMTTSMQIAQECLNHHEEESEMEGITDKDASQIIEGIEHFAQAIDTVLNRIKVRFLDTIIRLEHTPKGSQSGVSLEVRISKIDYFDEAGLGKTTPTETGKPGYEQQAFASKKFHIEGLTLYTDEFPAKSKAKSAINPSSESNSSPESGSKVSGSGSGDSFKTAETSPAEDKKFEYNHEKTVRKLITNSSIPMEPILFARFTGSQEISLKLKQADVMGPKVDLRMVCGSLIMFLSPRQIHLLLELSEGVASPDKLELEPSVPRMVGGKQKPMDPNDFRKVENELLRELRTPPVSSHALNQHQGWSNAPLEDSDDEFVPMGSGSGGLAKNMSSSQLSGCSDMDSSFSSNMSCSTVRSTSASVSATPYRYTGAGVMMGDHFISGSGRKKSEHSGSRLTHDPSAAVTHFRVQISSVAAVVLHEDVLTTSVENSNMVSKASVAEMQAKSEDFFTILGVHGLFGYSFNAFQEARKKFNEACQINHLRFMAAPLTVEGNEKSSTNKWEMSVNMSLGCAEILECLVDSSVSPVKIEYSDLLLFTEKIEEPTEAIYSGATEPKLKVSISQSQNMTPTGRTRRISKPKLDIKVNLGDCVSEIDMSIVDRISALINRQEVCTKAAEEMFSPELPPSYLNNQACFKQTLDDATLHPETRVNIKVSSTSLTVKLRFPIPDLRPTSNMDRVPWWKRNIRESPLSTSRLDAILYPNDDGVITKLGAGISKSEDCEDQITLALKMDFDLTRNLKTIILAGCMRGATLRHYMCTSPESWVTQLGDMFDVQDYPIAGYVLPDVVTEMNFHLWGCALDYRPLHLPLRAMLTVDACSISSNLTISSDANVLHFIIEDAALFLSDKLSVRNVDLKKNYICVADLGVFELCLRMVEDMKEKKPKIDLLASNNMIHIRTCADSCKALLELMIYLASDGDLTKEASSVPSTEAAAPTSTYNTSATSSPISECATMKPETQETIFNPRMRESDSQQLEMVRGMMDDAMIESTPSTSSCDEDDDADPSLYLKKGVEVFFFPDDNMKQTAVTVPTVQKDTSKKDEAASETELTDTEYALKEAQKEQLDNPFEEYSSGTDEEFCILDDAPGTGIKSPSGEPQVRILTQDPVIIIDNHFTVPLGKVDQLRAPKHFPAASMKYTLQELTVVWHMYGGSDFKKPSQGTLLQTRRVTISDSNGNPDSVCGNYPSKTSLPQKTYIATEPSVTVRASEVHFSNRHVSPTTFKKSPPHSPHQQSRMVWQAVGGPGRKHDTLLELQLSKVRFQHEIYPETAQQASRNVLLIYDVEIKDKLASSKINKFLYQFSSETCPRQAHANMVQVKALTTRPDGRHGPQETSLKISLQPIRLHVDQDALLFLFQFFEELLASDKEGESGEEERPQSSTLVQAPIMTVNINQAAQLSVTDNQQLLVNLEEKSPVSDTEEKSSKADENSPTYFKSFVFSPDVPIKIDYHGKHVDIHSQYGYFIGLIIGLGQLNQSELTLKSIVHKSGLLGMDKLIQYVTNEWVNDIRRNQLPSVLGGVGPMHSVGKLVGGVRDLFLLPIEQYQKDGRLFRGIQRGTSAFTTSSAHAALDLTGRFVGFIQSTAETMYDMVSSGPSVHHRYRLRSGHPQDIREGVTTAYGVVRDGIGETASAIVQAATQEHQHKGVSGAIGGVLRQIPPTVMQPIILASEAAGTVIGGMKNQLVPDARKEAADKWKA
nr:autophagy-related protein 2 homolog B-like isoform X2 [Procambarus clarkii]